MFKIGRLTEAQKGKMGGVERYELRVIGEHRLSAVRRCMGKRGQCSSSFKGGDETVYQIGGGRAFGRNSLSWVYEMGDSGVRGNVKQTHKSIRGSPGYCRVRMLGLQVGKIHLPHGLIPLGHIVQLAFSRGTLLPTNKTP
jgi:hypothetical protein